MADDIDDLLNEVENSYISSKPGAQAKAPPRKPPAKPKGKTDLDDMIDEIFGDDDSPIKEKKPRGSHSSSTSTTRASKSEAPSFGAGSGKKCFPVYLSGPDCANGVATAINKRSCDRLRCTDCDFKVSIFDNYQWHSSIDYLFLRNNIPDFDRLKPKLVKKRGSRAYACQCKSRNVTEVTDLQQISDLKWVCGKH